MAVTVAPREVVDEVHRASRALGPTASEVIPEVENRFSTVCKNSGNYQYSLIFSGLGLITTLLLLWL